MKEICGLNCISIMRIGISYHIGTTEELMSVYEIAVSSNIDKIKLRVEQSLNSKSFSPNN